jgi:hypothetical protein
VMVTGHPRVYAVADEDLERENDDKTASVHFLRFELDAKMVASLKGGATLAVGVNHPQYRAVVDNMAPAVRAALLQDLN